MKKVTLLIILIVSCNARGQLANKLYDLAQALSEVSILLNANTENQKPKEETVKPVPITTWGQLVQENKKREALSNTKASELTVFNVYINISAHYPDLLNLQKEYMKANPELVKKFQQSPKSCGNFIDDLHMTLVYLNIPIETKNVSNAEDMKVQLKDAVVQWLQMLKPNLKPIIFEFTEQEKTLVGKNKDRSFITALFTPSESSNPLREKFLLPLAQSLYPKYPYAWIGFLENPDYHVSLIRLLSGCITETVTTPNPLPPVSLYKFETGTLMVSVSGGGTKSMPALSRVNW